MFTWRRKWELPKDLLLDGKTIDLSQSNQTSSSYAYIKGNSILHETY